MYIHKQTVAAGFRFEWKLPSIETDSNISSVLF